MAFMRKLCIAVIVLSFFGFGPLKTFFQQDLGLTGQQIIQKVKAKTEINIDDQKAANFLIAEKFSNQLSTKAVLLKYDGENKKIMIGSILIPSLPDDNNLEHLKQTAEKNYHLTINHAFIIERSGLARIIDLLAPNGIPLNKEKFPHLIKENTSFHGNELLSLMDEVRSDPSNQEKFIRLLSSIKKEIAKIQSPEKLMAIAPALLNETLNSVSTDLGKGQLLTLGISAFTNPITSVEVFSIPKKEGVETPVNLPFNESEQKSMIN